MPGRALPRLRIESHGAFRGLGATLGALSLARLHVALQPAKRDKQGVHRRARPSHLPKPGRLRRLAIALRQQVQQTPSRAIMRGLREIGQQRLQRLALQGPRPGPAQLLFQALRIENQHTIQREQQVVLFDQRLGQGRMRSDEHVR